MEKRAAVLSSMASCVSCLWPTSLRSEALSTSFPFPVPLYSPGLTVLNRSKPSVMSMLGSCHTEYVEPAVGWSRENSPGAGGRTDGDLPGRARALTLFPPVFLLSVDFVL